MSTCRLGIFYHNFTRNMLDLGKHLSIISHATDLHRFFIWVDYEFNSLFVHISLKYMTCIYVCKIYAYVYKCKCTFICTLIHTVRLADRANEFMVAEYPVLFSYGLVMGKCHICMHTTKSWCKACHQIICLSRSRNLLKYHNVPHTNKTRD